MRTIFDLVYDFITTVIRILENGGEEKNDGSKTDSEKISWHLE